jgi:hypothetical protein
MVIVVVIVEVEVIVLTSPSRATNRLAEIRTPAMTIAEAMLR